MSTAPEHFLKAEREWRPAEIVETDVVTARPAATFAALLDRPSPVVKTGDALPPLWHWFLFPALHSQSELGEDGHAADAAFTPPLPERRRMFGGGRLTVTEPLRCGDEVVRRSGVTSVRAREGGSGWLLLVTVRHEFTVDGSPRLVEEQDLVYRAPPPASPAQSAVTASAPAPSGPWRVDLATDPVLLFRFSALTTNAHRIHYDRTYTTEVEGYPGLVVHGPLLALLLLEVPRRFAPGHEVASFSWRAKRPLFDGELVRASGLLNGDTVTLAAGTDRAHSAVTGDATLR